MAKDILEEIVAHKRIEIEQQKAIIAPATLYSNVETLMAEGAIQRRSMRESLANSASGIIAEFKRKSPSKGWIKEEGMPDIIPASYSQNGASAISILTDEQYFGGNLRYVRIARPTVSCPILRKDFIVDEYQLYQAKMVGADAVLLIAADLTKEECKTLAKKAHQLQLETLLEVHAEVLSLLGGEVVDDGLPLVLVAVAFLGDDSSTVAHGEGALVVDEEHAIVAAHGRAKFGIIIAKGEQVCRD